MGREKSRYRIVGVAALAFLVFLASDFLGGAEAREVRIFVDFEYADAREFSEGLAAVKSNDQWGYIDLTGRVAVSFEYRVPDVGPFSEGVAFVGDRFIDVRGNPVFDGKTFEQASSFSEGLSAVQTNGQWGFIDPNGRFAIPSSYEGAGDFSGGMAPVKKDGLWGYIDIRGRMLIEPRFVRAGAFSRAGKAENYLAPVELEGKIGYIDRSGRFVVRPTYDEGGRFSNALAPVCGSWNRNDWGYINAAGKEIIPRRFHGAGFFNDGLAPVATNARWGYIDLTGKLEIAALYDNARPFSEGAAAVERDGKWGYIRVK
ncbi:MAG: WG repeat-containing protein [Synergistaceae bacterium]|nr:WG repeat-containing protein [Synergistaceae bacterium]